MTDKTALFATLSQEFGPRFSTSEALREQHGRGESYHALAAPDAVVAVRSTEEVRSVLRQCHQARVPVIPYGAGTSLEGQLSAVRGGISLDLSGMDQVLRVSAEDMDCTVQAGVTREALNQHLRDQGLFFPIDPGANATIGGMAATRASGTNAVRYGTMREVVLALRVVLADGEVLTTASRARKSAAGYDLTRLFVGSEGTLGVITEVSLRLFGIPPAISAAVCAFADVESAVAAATAVTQFGIPVARMELMDRELIAMTNARFDMSLPVADTLAFEFHGSDDSVAEQAAMVAEIVQDFGGTGFEASSDAAERARLWKARHNAYYTVVNQRKNARGWSSDVCVPVSQLGACVRYARELLTDCPIPASIVGHVGDGNFHVAFALDTENAAEIAQVKEINAALVARAIAAGGTCTGEHGIGTGKIGYMALEHDPIALRLMHALKAAVDPAGLMNPGKILPAL
jgi:D-lactate dehydrogenase (cytochrome)